MSERKACDSSHPQLAVSLPLLSLSIYAANQHFYWYCQLTGPNHQCKADSCSCPSYTFEAKFPFSSGVSVSVEQMYGLLVYGLYLQRNFTRHYVSSSYDS